MAWTHEAKKSVLNVKKSGILAGLDDIVSSIGKEDKNFYELEVAEVIDICLSSEHEAFEALGGYSNGAIGRIKIRLIHSEPIVNTDSVLEGSLGSSVWARPLFSNIKTYPLKREFVIVGQYLSKSTKNTSEIAMEYYYTSPLSIFGSINSNALFIKGAEVPLGKKSYSDSEAGHEKIEGEERDKKSYIRLGDEYSPSVKVKPLLPREGDMTFEGRFGQSIRFGSPDGHTTPNIYIRAGQSELEEEPQYLKPINENINLDGSSIYMTVDEKVLLERSTDAFSAASASSTIPEEFSGKQIILNSDSVVLNSRDGTLVGMAKNGIGFSTSGDITLDAIGTTTIASPVINLGFEAKEPVVLGNQLEEILLGILDEVGKIVDAITAISVPTGTGPSGPPVNSPQFLSIKNVGLKAIENKLTNILSKQNFTK